jgi:hypothetical protein
MAEEQKRRRDYRRELAQRAEKDAEPQPGDEIGTWCKEELLEFQRRFEAAIAREVRRGQ